MSATPRQGYPRVLSPVPRRAPGTPSRFKPTPEQEAIIGTTVAVLKVKARAGTGKTAVLEARAEARPEQRFLYLAFNRAVKMEAEARFPNNVTCKTGHGLAYATHGRRYGRDKLGEMRPVQIMNLAPWSQQLSGLDQAAVVCDTLHSYLNGADPELDLGHIPEGAAVRWPVGHPRARAALAAGHTPDPSMLAAETVLRLTRELWRRARDPKDTEVKMPHDGYLKLYQLAEPHLEFDEILLDEAQDSNPVILDIVLRQRAHCRVTLVGDNCQSIYGFRAATNAMETVQADAELPLARSFRFGQGVAEVANAILAHKQETVLLSGRADLRTRIVMEPTAFDQNRLHTVVARTNAGIIQESVRAAAAGRRLHFVGGLDSYPLGLLEDAHRLWRGQGGQVKDPALRAYRNWDALAKTAKLLKTGQEAILVRMVEKHRDQIPQLIESVRRAAVPAAEQADLILTSAHKAKGLEWERVRLTEDFFNPFQERKAPPPDDGAEPEDEETRRQRDSEELNLLYVAATRAQSELCVNESLREFMRRRQAAVGLPEGTLTSEPETAAESHFIESARLTPPGGDLPVTASSPLAPGLPASVELDDWQEAARRLVAMGPRLLSKMLAELSPGAIHRGLDALERGEPAGAALAALGEPVGAAPAVVAGRGR